MKALISFSILFVFSTAFAAGKDSRCTNLGNTVTINYNSGEVEIIDQTKRTSSYSIGSHVSVSVRSIRAYAVSNAEELAVVAPNHINSVSLKYIAISSQNGVQLPTVNSGQEVINKAGVFIADYFICF